MHTPSPEPPAAQTSRPLPIAGIAGAFLALAAAGAAAEPSDPEPPAPRLAGMVSHDEIRESSGLAASHRSADLLWTHNDSGDTPRLFAIDRQGRFRGQLRVEGAQAIDWEDLCSVQVDGASYLVIGDIGDNGGRREQVTLYWVREPREPSGSQPVVRQVDFRYQDGPRDCEAVAVDPVRREILLVEKQYRRPTSRVYRLDWPTPLEGGQPPAAVQTARPIGQIPVAAVTSMDISPDGRHCMVATYAHGYLFARQEAEDWPTALARPGRTVPLPLRRQGEAVCFGRQGTELWLTSEKSPVPLWNVPLSPAAPP